LFLGVRAGYPFPLFSLKRSSTSIPNAKKMKILIACEYSGTVRDAFLALGHDAYSNDIIDCETNPGRHLKMDCVQAIQSDYWDLIIIHIPCTAMGVCGNGTYGIGKARHHERIEALEWSLKVWDIAVKHGKAVSMENPASVLFPALRKYKGADIQYIQPYMFGHKEQKKTGLALYNLPRLQETDNVYEGMMLLPKKERERIFYMSPGPDRGKERARFYTGIAEAMADQWSAPEMQSITLPVQLELFAA
jgi:hypothetical protein